MLKSTGSEFKGFLVDEYTTLPEADDRILATSLVARWRHVGEPASDWNAAYDAVRDVLLATFATTYSRALQETLYAMGRPSLDAHPGIAEISVLGAQPAPLPGRPRAAVRDSRTRRGVHRRRPALRPDRGHGDARRRVAAVRPGWPCQGSSARRPRRASDLLRLPRRARAGSTTCWPGSRTPTGSACSTPPTRAPRALRRRARGGAVRPPADRRAGGRAEPARSGEQAGVDPSAGDTAARLAAGNAAYEERFDRVFLIRAAGRDAERDPGRARPPARQRRRRPSAPRPSTSCARSRCSDWKAVV